MTTPNNAAALLPCPFCGAADIEAYPADRERSRWNVCCGNPGCVTRGDNDYLLEADAIAAWNRRATLAQPDALTSQPSGGGELPFAFYNADANRFFWFDETIGAPVKLSGVVNLYIHPSADAPGVAVDEWRPIESAPKEAPYWVVWSAYYQRPVVVTQRSNDNTYWEGDWDFDVQATHWTAALAPKPEGEL